MKKVVIKSLDRPINESHKYIEYEYSPVREGIQQIQLACMTRKGIGVSIKKISIRKAVLYIKGDNQVIDDLFVMLALSDFSDKFKWRFCLFNW